MSHSLTPEAAIVQGMGGDVVPVTVTEAANRAVVFIDTGSCKGSGTLTRLPHLGDGRALLLTCCHVIPDKETAARCLVSIDRYNEEKPGTTFSGEELFDLSMFKTDTTNVPGWGPSGRLLDFTIIGVDMDVLKKANLPGGYPEPLLLTDYQTMKEERLKKNDQISVVHFPKDPPGFQRCTNTLNVIKTEGPIFGHNATTHGGSSGCPIFREFQRRWVIVGLHRAGLALDSVAHTNLATHISAVCDAYMDRPYNGTVPDLGKFVRTDESSEDGAANTATDGSGGDTGPNGQSVMEAAQKHHGSPELATTKLPSAEGILDLFRDQFLKDVDAKAVVGELKQKGIVPQSCQEKVAKADGFRQRNEILHDCLKRTCTREALIKACDIIIELAEGGEENNPKMKKVGEDMKMKLETGPGQRAANGGTAQGQPQVPAAPFVASEFLEKYEEEFFSDVYVKQSLQRLVRKGVISNVVKDRIENESDEQEAKETLFNHLSGRATTATLREWCEVAIAANGYPKMQELGTKMKAALP